METNFIALTELLQDLIISNYNSNEGTEVEIQLPLTPGRA